VGSSQEGGGKLLHGGNHGHSSYGGGSQNPQGGWHNQWGEGFGLNWIGLDGMGWDWIIGLNWIGLDGIGLV
jgi:hypothetical protein